MRTAEVIEMTMADVLPRVADRALVETRMKPLAEQPSLAERELRFDFRGQPWVVRIQLSDDRSEGDWLSISDQAAGGGGPERIEIRVCMAHPFMVRFAQAKPEDIEALLRVAAALALSEKIARRSGVKYAGTIRRNLNEILLEALSEP